MTTLAALFSTLLPGDDIYPPAHTLELAGRAEDYPHFAPAIAGVLAAVPGNFASLDAEAKTGVLRALETAEPALFQAFLTAAYSLYYSDEAVLKVIADAEGYTPRAPQPEGYALEPFDASIVEKPAKQMPSWRSTEKDDG